jgi:hypothetical protein
MKPRFQTSGSEELLFHKTSGHVGRVNGVDVIGSETYKTIETAHADTICDLDSHFAPASDEQKLDYHLTAATYQPLLVEWAA